MDISLSPDVLHWLGDGGLGAILIWVGNEARKARADKREALSEQTMQYQTARVALDNARQQYDQGVVDRLRLVEGDLKTCRDECTAQISEGHLREHRQAEENANLRERLARVEGRYEGLMKVPVKDLGPLIINPASVEESIVLQGPS